ncbi:AsmA family protein [Castellaniella sp.]|uniref:AsmA family protein n=1 Tax=Castellaniella sp. TaxID=1955812 RepID=UPI002AFFCF7D|nr:AsmA family protein [Castellaniella sp.]
MNVWLKRGVFSLVLALLVAVVGLAIFLLTFNPNAYKSRLEQIVFDRYARTLTIDGDISLSLFPRIGLAVSQVSLSNRQADDTFISIDSARFAVAIWPLLSNQLVVDHVAITGLKAWLVRDSHGRFNFSDLLGADERAAPDAAEVTGPLAVVARAIAPRPGGRSDLNIDIAGLELKGGQIHYLDQADGLSTTLSGIEANTGRVTFDQPFDVSLRAKIAGADPVQDAQLQAQALLRLDPARQGYSAQKINVQLNGRLGNLDQAEAALKGSLAYKGAERRFAADNLALTIRGEIVGAHPIANLKASLGASQLRLDQAQMELQVAKLALRAEGQDRGRQLVLAVDAPSLAISPQSAQADPLVATIKSTDDQVALAMSLGLEGLTGNARQWQFRTASLDTALTQDQRLLRLKFTSPLAWDTSLRKGALTAIQGDVSLRESAQKQALAEFPLIGSLHLDLLQDVLDVDLSAVIDGSQAILKSTTTGLDDPQTIFSLSAERLLLDPWLPRDAAVAPVAPDSAPAVQPDTADQPAAAQPPAETPIDLAWLKGQNIKGDVSIADLRVHDMQLTQVALPIQLAGGVLAVPAFSADLYGGSAVGQLQLAVNQAAAQTLALKMDLDKVSAAPLMQALTGHNLLSGRAAAQLDLKTQGTSLQAWMQALSGRVSWQVREGAVHGVDAAQTLTELAASLGNIAKGRMDAVSSPFDLRRSTLFSTLDGRVDLKNGQGQVTKLQVNTASVRVTAGKPATLDVPRQQLDLQLLIQVATRPPKALQDALRSLAGVTIPVQLTGAWVAPDYAVQWDAIRNQTIQQVVKSGLMGLLKGNDPIDQLLPEPETEPAAPAVDKDPVERIGNALKGLLGQ